MLSMLIYKMTMMDLFVEDLHCFNTIQSGTFTLRPANFDPSKVLYFIKSIF